MTLRPRSAILRGLPRAALRVLVSGRRLARRGAALWTGSLGAKSLVGEITRLGAILLAAGLIVSLIAAEIARRSAADDLADFALVDFLEEVISPDLAFCASAGDDACLRGVYANETAGLWRITLDGVDHLSATFGGSEIAAAEARCAVEAERTAQGYRFYTCRLEDAAAFRLAERRGGAALAAVEFSTWQRAADRAGERLVGGRGLQLAVGVMAAALVLVLALSLWATRARLGRRFDGLGAALERYRDGESQRIEGAYPSEIQALADSLNRAIDKKTALMARQRRNVAKMAHDLRHQLVAIDLAARPDAKGAVDQEDLAGELAVLNALVERYLTLTDWIGPAEGAPPADLSETLQSARKAFSRRFREAPLTFETDCPAGLTVRAHPADMRIILSNLVGNAHRFAASRIRLSARAVDNFVEICVEDDGPGIPEDQRARVMAWGGRLDAAPAGSGFGLSIVAEQVSELYGGALRLEDSSLGGLRAVVRLPLRPAPGS